MVGFYFDINALPAVPPPLRLEDFDPL